jgi:hypothetical protein
MTPDITWPCRCTDCCPPLDCCDVCGVDRGQVCAPHCSEHPSRRKPCRTLAVEYPERIARGDA